MAKPQTTSDADAAPENTPENMPIATPIATPETTPVPGGGSWTWDAATAAWVPSAPYAPPAPLAP